MALILIVMMIKLLALEKSTYTPCTFLLLFPKLKETLVTALIRVGKSVVETVSLKEVTLLYDTTF